MDSVMRPLVKAAVAQVEDPARPPPPDPICQVDQTEQTTDGRGEMPEDVARIWVIDWRELAARSDEIANGRWIPDDNGLLKRISRRVIDVSLSLAPNADRTWGG
jgi:hypothetical protein